MKLIRRGVATIIATLLLAFPAAAAVVHGQIWLSKGAARAATRAGAKAKPVAQAGVRDAVVYLQMVPEKVEKKLSSRGWFAPKPRSPRIVQQDLRFAPRVLAAVAGTAVEFRNLDRVFHSTFSVSAANRFDLGKYAPGHRDTVLFDQPGVVNLHCDIHPDENGFVVVVPNHAYARPDSFGRFDLKKLPPGRYTANAWHPRLGESSAAFEVPKRGNVALQLVF